MTYIASLVRAGQVYRVTRSAVAANAAGDIGPQRMGRLPRGNACQVAAVYPRDDDTR